MRERGLGQILYDRSSWVTQETHLDQAGFESTRKMILNHGQSISFFLHHPTGVPTLLKIGVAMRSDG
jgi:hypothetical protein